MVTQNVRVLRSCVQQLLILHCYSLNKKKEKKKWIIQNLWNAKYKRLNKKGKKIYKPKAKYKSKCRVQSRKNTKGRDRETLEHNKTQHTNWQRHRRWYTFNPSNLKQKQCIDRPFWKTSIKGFILLPFSLTGSFKCCLIFDQTSNNQTAGGNHLRASLRKLMLPCLRNLRFCKYLCTFQVILTKSSYPPKFFSMSLFPPILQGHAGPIPSSHLENLSRPAVHRGANTYTHRQTHLHSHSGAN